MLGLMDDTNEAISVNREQMTGLPATYSHDLARIPGSTGCPRLSSFPLPKIRSKMNFKMKDYELNERQYRAR